MTKNAVAQTMRPAFFVQNNLVERLTAPVAAYARRKGIDCEDRSSHLEFQADDCGIDWFQYDVVLPYGSIQFLRRLKESTLARFVHHDEERFANSSWVDVLGADAVNGGGHCVPVHSVADAIRSSGALHVRPERVDKAFAGAVYGLDSWAAICAQRNLSTDLSCWISPRLHIQAEWRCWIVGGDVVEISRYRTEDQFDVRRESSTEVHAASEALAGRYHPASCFVVDIALVSGAFKVLEYNPIHSSGWYAADVGRVLDPWVDWSGKHLSMRSLSGLHRA